MEYVVAILKYLNLIITEGGQGNGYVFGIEG
jgi:hypothetical protein